MKTRIKIIIPTILFLAIGLFYLYIVANGYSPYPEGLSLHYYYESPTNDIFSSSQEIKKLTDEDLTDAPIIKKMLEIALSQEFPLHSSGFTEIDFFEFKSYRVYRDGEDIRVKNYMSNEDLEKYQNWIFNDFQSQFFEYKGKFFGISTWVA